MRNVARVALAAALAACCACHPSGTHRPPAERTTVPTALHSECKLQVLRSSAETVPLPALWTRPDDYFGRRLQVWGFLRASHEQHALFDPRYGPRGSIGLSLTLQRLGADASLLKPCYGMRVVADGYLTHFPDRVGPTLVLIPESIGLVPR